MKKHSLWLRQEVEDIFCSRKSRQHERVLPQNLLQENIWKGK
ncbi:hypothetical protein [Faecalicatena faecalis]|nr:hypothetical protein [Faecalicatena faecalis]